MVKHLPHSQNNQGYFFDVRKIPNDLLDLMLKYIQDSDDVLQEFLKSERDRIGIINHIKSSIKSKTKGEDKKANVSRRTKKDLVVGLAKIQTADDDIDNRDEDELLRSDDDDIESVIYDKDYNSEDVNSENDSHEESDGEDEEEIQYSAADMNKSRRKIWSSVFYNSGKWNFQKKMDPKLKKELDSELKTIQVMYKTPAERRKSLTPAQRIRDEQEILPDVFGLEQDTDDEP